MSGLLMCGHIWRDWQETGKRELWLMPSNVWLCLMKETQNMSSQFSHDLHICPSLHSVRTLSRLSLLAPWTTSALTAAQHSNAVQALSLHYGQLWLWLLHGILTQFCATHSSSGVQTFFSLTFDGWESWLWQALNDFDCRALRSDPQKLHLFHASACSSVLLSSSLTISWGKHPF